MSSTTILRNGGDCMLVTKCNIPEDLSLHRKRCAYFKPRFVFTVNRYQFQFGYLYRSFSTSLSHFRWIFHEKDMNKHSTDLNGNWNSLYPAYSDKQWVDSNATQHLRGQLKQKEAVCETVIPAFEL